MVNFIVAIEDILIWILLDLRQVLVIPFAAGSELGPHTTSKRKESISG